MIRNWVIGIARSPIIAMIGYCLLSNFARADECLPLKAIDNVGSLVYFDPSKPDQQFPLYKTLLPKKVCGVDDPQKGRYSICLGGRQVLVPHAQFKVRVGSFAPPPPPDDPSRRDHAGTYAKADDPWDTGGDDTEVLARAFPPPPAPPPQKTVASPNARTTSGPCGCKISRPEDCD